MFKPYGKRSFSTFIIASRVSDVLDNWPALYTRLQTSRLKYAKHRMVGPETRLAIEAYPRSGTSFAHHAFVSVNPDCENKIATHMHRASQVINATRAGVPTLLVVRHPMEAVTSLIALGVHSEQLPMPNASQARACLAAALRRYALFHERIANLPEPVIASFEEVTDDLGKVIERLNRVCGTDFVPFAHSDDRVAALMSSYRRHATPNVDRDQIKKILRVAYECPNLADLRARAEAAFDEMIEQRDTQLAGSL